MDPIALYVGLDYHEAKVQVCVLNPEGEMLRNRWTGNDWRAIMAQTQGLGTVRRVALEACCGAADLADELVQRARWPVALAHTGYVARIKQGPDKTDFSDARLLADLVRVGYLPQVWLAPTEVRELRLIVRERMDLARQRRRIKQRIGALLREQRLFAPEQLSRWSKPWLAWLREEAAFSPAARWLVERHLGKLSWLGRQLFEVHQLLAEMTREDPLVQRLLAEPGIGPVTAWMLRAEVGRFDRFTTGRELSRFCGLSPRNTASGKRQSTAGLISAANGELRSVLIEAGHRLIRYQWRWATLAASMRDRGKPPSLVAAAVANRWMRWLYYRMVQVA